MKFAMRSTNFPLFLVFIMFAHIQQGTSVKCYQCSPDLPQCGERFDYTAAGVNIVDCDDNVGCQKVKHPTIGGGLERISRGCAHQFLCNSLSVCLTCKRDYCNSSVSLVPSFFTIFAITLVCARNYLQ